MNRVCLGQYFCSVTDLHSGPAPAWGLTFLLSCLGLLPHGSLQLAYEATKLPYGRSSAQGSRCREQPLGPAAGSQPLAFNFQYAALAEKVRLSACSVIWILKDELWFKMVLWLAKKPSCCGISPQASGSHLCASFSAHQTHIRWTWRRGNVWINLDGNL